MNEEKVDLSALKQKVDSIRSNEKILNKMATLVLKVYRKTIWSVETRLNETELDYYHLGSRHLNEIFEYLDDHGSIINKKKLEEKICSLYKSKLLIEIIDKGLVKVKRYPRHGEELYKILYNKYIHEEIYSEEELIELSHYERTTYFKRKKKAEKLLGVAIWGFVTADLR